MQVELEDESSGTTSNLALAGHIRLQITRSAFLGETRIADHPYEISAPMDHFAFNARKAALFLFKGHCIAGPGQSDRGDILDQRNSGCRD